MSGQHTIATEHLRQVNGQKTEAVKGNSYIIKGPHVFAENIKISEVLDLGELQTSSF